MFIQRAISGIALVLILGAGLLIGNQVLLLLTLFISIIGFYEMTRATKVLDKGKKPNLLAMVGMLGIFGYYIVIGVVKVEQYVMFVVTLTILAILCVYVFTYPRFHANQIMATVFAFLYAPIMLSYIYLTRTLTDGIYLVWLIFISSWICDTCAYLVGMTIGKHKLAKVLSPKKSIEGAIGGVVGAGLVGFLYGYIIKVDKPWIFALIVAITAIVSQVGDLAASAIKRNFEIKDYGNLIPGHGGILDRFDSVIFTAPMIYYLSLLWIIID